MQLPNESKEKPISRTNSNKIFQREFQMKEKNSVFSYKAISFNWISNKHCVEFIIPF